MLNTFKINNKDIKTISVDVIVVSSLLFLKASLTGLDKLSVDANRVSSSAQNLRNAPDLSHFLLVKNKIPLDLQVFSGIGKTMKELQ